MAKNAATPRRAKQTNPATELAASVVAPLPARNEHSTSFSTQALFWRPHHPAMSPALGQLPFLFWLTETVRPRTIVQFGTGDGVVYMSLCQASERLGDSAICLGIQAEEPLLPPAMHTQHDAQYSDFSELRHGDVRTAAPQFSGEIDLLVLNQPLDADAAARFRNNWLPLLSSRSVILLCHPEKVFPDQEAREILFPARDRSIVFGPVSTGGHTVEVILHGKEQAERLVALASQRPGEHAYLVTRQVFNRLGQGIEAIQKAEDVQKERDSLHARLQSAQEQLKTRETELGDQRAEVGTAQKAEAAAVSRQAEMVARLFDLEQLLSEKSQQTILLGGQKAGLESRIAELQAQAATREAEHKAALEAVAALRAELETSSAAKSTLEAHFNTLKAGHEEQTRQTALLTERHEARVAEQKAEIEALHEQKSALEALRGEARAAQEELAEQIALLTKRYEAQAAEQKAEIEALHEQKAALETQLGEARTACDEQARQVTLLTERHEARVAEQKAEIEALHEQKAALEAQLGEARAAHDERIEDIALVTGKFNDDIIGLEAEIRALRDQKAALEKTAAEAGQLNGKHSDAAAKLKAEIETLRGQKAAIETQLREARAAHDERIADIAVLTGKYTDDTVKLRADLRAATAEVQQTQQMLAELQKTAGEELGRAVKALLPSGRNGLLVKKSTLPKLAKLLIDTGIVDPDWYLEHHTDVAAAGMDPAVHYVLHGAEEGRIPRRALEDAGRGIR